MYTDNEVLLRLLRSGTLTIPELCAEMSCTEQIGAKYLRSLHGRGYAVRSRGSSGYTYAVADKAEVALATNYHGLLTAILASSAGLDRERAVVELWPRAGIYNWQSLRPVLRRLCAWFTERLTESNWRMYDDGTAAVRLRNCVYRNVVDERRALCALDAAIIARATGAEVTHTHCIKDGCRYCEFKLEE